jgi:hypothetical protein
LRAGDAIDDGRALRSRLQQLSEKQHRLTAFMVAMCSSGIILDRFDMLGVKTLPGPSLITIVYEKKGHHSIRFS